MRLFQQRREYKEGAEAKIHTYQSCCLGQGRKAIWHHSRIFIREQFLNTASLLSHSPIQ